MTTIKFRRDTSANWTSVNPIPAQGEPCYETDTGKLKIGNGSDNYVALPYVSDGGGSAGTTDYTQLENKPQINSVELTGNKTLNDLGIQPKGNYLTALPDNAVTTDTTQTISGQKIFSAKSNFNNGCQFNSSSYSDNYFKKGLKIGNVGIYNSNGNELCINGSSTRFLTFDDDNIIFRPSNSAQGMKIADGVITTAPNNPYLKIKERKDYNDTHNLEISCDTTNNNWNIACGDQTFINTANIDTTYMKWDNTNSKLTVDTAAVAGLAMPSNTKVKLTLGSSGTTYTAPADGYVCVGFFGSTGGNFEILAQVSASTNYTVGAARCQCPVLKGEFSCWYNNVQNDNSFEFYFHYAVGTAPTNTEPAS